jgi:hypothetical protein
MKHGGRMYGNVAVEALGSPQFAKVVRFSPMYANKFPAVFGLPDHEATIWRYMDLAKFASLLENRALFFCRSDLFDDRFEGSYPKGAAVEAALPRMIADVADDPTLPERIGKAKQMSCWRKQLREAVLVSCWHISEHESAAMWKLYVQSDKGISIKSTVQRLIDSIKCDEEVYVGAVQYRDYDVAEFPSMNVFHPFISKRKSFEYERELRAVIWDEDRFAGLSGTYPVPDHKRNNGTYAATDLSLLIEEIRVLPGAATEFLECIALVCDKYNLKKEVKQSRLDDSPLY